VIKKYDMFRVKVKGKFYILLPAISAQDLAMRNGLTSRKRFRLSRVETDRQVVSTAGASLEIAMCCNVTIRPDKLCVKGGAAPTGTL